MPGIRQLGNRRHPAGIIESMGAINDESRLRTLFRAAIQSASLEEFTGIL